MLWHEPRFACLDECTSAVALDGEEEIYSHIRDIGCTVLTASQKPWLTNFHSSILELTADHEGGWEYKPIDESLRFKGLTRMNAKAYVDKRQEDGGGVTLPAPLPSTPPMQTGQRSKFQGSPESSSSVPAGPTASLLKKWETEADEMFRSMDKDKSGSLSKNELKNYLKKNQQLKNTVMQGGSYKDIWADLDADQDGTFTPGEWRNFWVKRQSQAVSPWASQK